jgi:alkanesulfonate monooxygenase SsuD/methylene tetrahydromethanopterin reductase-like flavin-dependent oxidoreductase (luciferase family)
MIPNPSDLMTSLKDFGIMLEPQLGMTVERIVRTAKNAESLGFGYLFRSDHLLPTDDRRGLDSPECWTSLGVVAASTKEIRFGPMVSPMGFHNPAMLVKMALTIHSYSRGRLRLGLGTGWYESEYRAYGYEFPSFPVRFRQFTEGLRVIHGLANQERIDFDGEFFKVHTDSLPRPSGKVHLILGGRSERVVKEAAIYADEWNYFTRRPEDFTRGKELLEENRGERRVEISETGPFMLGKSESELEANAQKVISNQSMNMTSKEFVNQLRHAGSPCGSPDEFAGQVGKRIDSGVNRFYFQFLAPDDFALMELLADTLKQVV